MMKYECRTGSVILIPLGAAPFFMLDGLISTGDNAEVDMIRLNLRNLVLSVFDLVSRARCSLKCMRAIRRNDISEN